MKTTMLKKKDAWDKIFILSVMLVPALILFVLFVIVPIFQAVYYSMYKWNGLGPLTNFKGLNNYKLLLQDSVFWKALKNNVIVVVLSLVLQLPLAIALAILIGRDRFKGVVLFRTLFFLPYILSEIITGVIWRFIYNPQFGLFTSVFKGLFPEGLDLLGNVDTVFPAIFVVILWKYFGLHMTINIAGLQGIPKELEEAATIDGANAWQKVRHVILPLLRPTIIMSVFFAILGAFQIFDLVWAMGKGEPVHAAETMVTYLYKYGFQRYSLGYGSAIAVAIFIICLGFNIFYQKFITREEK